MKEPTVEEALNALVHYDPESGELTYKEATREFFTRSHAYHFHNRHKIGKRAFATVESKGGYLCGRFRDKIFKAHRVAWLLHYGKWPDNTIDHKNRITSDNRIINLRDVTQAENNMNR